MQEIRSLSEFNKLKAKGLLIIDFYATWCGPCKTISPTFEKISKQHEPSSAFITFAKLDVDKAKDVAQACGITAMPTFQFFKEAKKVDQVKGADVQQLTTKIGYYTAAAVKENAAQGTNAGESSEKGSSKDTTPGSLRSLIDIPTARLLNASNLSSVRNIASPPPAGYAIASASGPRVLIHLPFSKSVNPSSLKITIAKGYESNAPSRIRVGTNVPVRITKSQDGVESNDLDLESSLAKAENIQAFNVYSDEYVNGTAELKLKASKFTSIKSLTIRIDANMSGDEKVLSKVGVMDIVGVKA